MHSTIRGERDGIFMEITTEETLLHQQKYPLEHIADMHNHYSGPQACHLNYCGFERCAPDYSFGPYVRTSYLLHVVLRGKGTYQVGKQHYTVSAGQVFLIYPADVTIYRADHDEPWHYGWVGFSGFASEDHLEQSGFSRQNHVISVSNPAGLEQCIRNMMEKHQISYVHELYRTAELLRFFALMMESQPQGPSAPRFYSRGSYAKVAKNYIDQRYMLRLRVSEIAESIGIDRSYLTKCFQEEYHISPQEYMIQKRALEAKRLLAETSQPISKIAVALGYSDVLSFSKMFRQNTGQAPTAFRRDGREKTLQTAESEAVPAFPHPNCAQLAMRYMGDHFQEQIQIAVLAGKLGVSRSHLSKCFRAEYGMPPQEFLTRLRMDHAKALLAEDILSMAAIAAQVGYSNQQTFSKGFRQYVGISPSEYRKYGGRKGTGKPE